MTKLTINEWQSFIRLTIVKKQAEDILTVEQLYKVLKALEKKLVGTNRQLDKKIMKKNGIFMQIIQECKSLWENKDNQYADPMQTELSKPMLLAWGLLYCQGEQPVKAKIFHELLQWGGEDIKSIAALDKDFPPMMEKMTNLAVFVPNIYEAKLTHLVPEHDPHHLFESQVAKIQPDLCDNFLDNVFEYDASLPKEDYISKIGKKAEIKWVFSAKEYRNKVVSMVSEVPK